MTWRYKKDTKQTGEVNSVVVEGDVAVGGVSENADVGYCGHQE